MIWKIVLIIVCIKFMIIHENDSSSFIKHILRWSFIFTNMYFIGIFYRNENALCNWNNYLFIYLILSGCGIEWRCWLFCCTTSKRINAIQIQGKKNNKMTPRLFHYSQKYFDDEKRHWCFCFSYKPTNTQFILWTLWLIWCFD